MRIIRSLLAHADTIANPLDDFGGTHMNDERILSLLEEIRDNQRVQIEISREAVARQSKSIGMQEENLSFVQKRFKIIPFLVALALALVVMLLISFTNLLF